MGPLLLEDELDHFLGTNCLGQMMNAEERGLKLRANDGVLNVEFVWFVNEEEADGV